MEDWSVQNTENKIYNNKRRTYLDKGDCKEGEVICRKCKGVGEINPPRELHLPVLITCPQCLGRGIVDWVTQAVERPIIFGVDSSSSSSSSSYSVRVSGASGTSGASFPKKPIGPPCRIINEGFSMPKWVTKIKRRISV